MLRKNPLRSRRAAYAAGEASNVITLALLVVIAKPLGVDLYGDFVAILALSSIVGVAVELGYLGLIIRTVARAPSSASASLRRAFRTQLMALPLMLLALYGLLVATGFAGDSLVAGMLVGASVAFRSLKQSLRGVCRGLERFDVEAAFLWLERVALLVLGSAAVWAGAGLVGLGLAFLVVRGADLLAMSLVVRRLAASSGDAASPSLTLAAALPFAATDFLWNMYYQVDAAMLKVLSTRRDTGLYGAAYRFVDIVQVLPRLLVVTAFPSMAVAWVEDRSRYELTRVRLQRLLTCAALPLLFVFIAWPESFIGALFGQDYVAGAPALVLLALGSYFAFHSFLFQQILQTSGREKPLAVALGLTVAGNVLLNLLLIPHWGFMGAAIATLATEIAYATGLAWLSFKTGSTRGSPVGWVEILGVVILGGVVVAANRIPDPWLVAGFAVVVAGLFLRVRPDRLLAER